MNRAVVFGYGDVGVRCLAAVLASGIDVPLVVTHEDDPAEARWFESLACFARERDIAVLTPETTPADTLYAHVERIRPRFIFSFYYRSMLPPRLLRLAQAGAFNVHGSLLPDFRGRAPINWAVLHGATQTGATLHYMVDKPDAGAIIAQRAVPIFGDDTALDVFRKVCCAAELLMHETLPRLIDGTATGRDQDLAAGRYFGRRRPEDGTIDWLQSAQSIHDLVRAVAPPFPGARTMIEGRPARIFRTLRAFEVGSSFTQPTLFAADDRCYVRCGDGRVLRVLDLEIAGQRVLPAVLAQRIAASSVPLPTLTP
jgi:methionyl-tRNA formyltransferase